ncbi:MAG: SAM-dependent methyltransferase [Flavobacteriaceae bacterium]|nr:SAM-dependent methyltransferase [Flavobacteriaceae bacterium]
MSKKTMRAVEALQEAQKIAFAPYIFQATISLRKLGIMDFIFNSKNGATLKEIALGTSVSEYGVGVLLEIAESSDIVLINKDSKYELTKIGYFLAFDNTVNVNINFNNDICYKGLYHLNDSILNGKAEGLKELGNWDTIYEGLSKLTPQQNKSWFEFDHYYSDYVFKDALEVVFKRNPKLIFDVGANTGKFAITCCEFNEDVKVKMVDLSGQLNVALANAKKNGFENRIEGHEIDWLSENPQIPTGADIIWMSQFLDCFSKDEIVKILSVCANSMDKNSELFIMETFTDRQKFDNAKFILEATSLYFTTMANGNSKMYKASEFMTLIDKAGLYLVEDINQIGENHTILICKKK